MKEPTVRIKVNEDETQGFDFMDIQLNLSSKNAMRLAGWAMSLRMEELQTVPNNQPHRALETVKTNQNDTIDEAEIQNFIDSKGFNKGKKR